MFVNFDGFRQTHSQLDATDDIDQDKMKVKMNVLQERLNAALSRENELAAELQATKRTAEDLQRQLVKFQPIAISNFFTLATEHEDQ
jgi:uncharacterized membrane protein (DUF106 family)